MQSMQCKIKVQLLTSTLRFTSWKTAQRSPLRNAYAKVRLRLTLCDVLILWLDVQAPAFFEPTDEQFFDPTDKTKPNLAFLKNHFYREGRLLEHQALYIIEEGTKLLSREPNVLEVDAPITGYTVWKDLV